MTKSCTSLFPFLVLISMVILLIGFALREQWQIRRQRTRAFDRQNTRFLKAMLGVALMSVVIFVFYLIDFGKAC